MLEAHLFQDLTPAELEPLAEVAAVRVLARRQAVFRTGETATHLFVVAAGQLKESLQTAQGDEMVFEILSRGAVFGEPALFTPERVRCIDVVAMEPSEVLAIDREALVPFLLRHPRAMMRALEGLAIQVATAVDDATGLVHLPIEERLLAKLIELAESHGEAGDDGTRIRLRLDQSTLARSVGATRENVNRSLTRLAGAGILQFDRGTITVSGIAELRALLGDWPVRTRRNRLRSRAI